MARHWNPGVVSRSESFPYPSTLLRASVDRNTIEEILEITGERQNYKQYYFPSDDYLMIYLRGGHINVNLPTGEITVTKVRNRVIFSEVNYLHYNKPKKLWTWFSDLFALALILMAISGLFLVRGKKGITGLGGVMTVIGILIPLVFLTIYLWL